MYLMIGWMGWWRGVLQFGCVEKDGVVEEFMGGRWGDDSLLGKELRYVGKLNVEGEMKEVMEEMIEGGLGWSLILDFD